ncbi:MAG: hypothetical protein OXH64_03265 [Rhodospirillaceae bacterium]|nr:hypothetical protein [Rhodospirillaceae bacterium]
MTIKQVPRMPKAGIVMLCGLTLLASGCVRAPLTQAYSIHQCVQNISATPQYMLNGNDSFEPNNPVLYNQCNTQFRVNVCYTKAGLRILDNENLDKMARSTRGKIICAARLTDYKIHPGMKHKLGLSATKRAEMRSAWRRANRVAAKK